ncbi:hypothetical protein BsWGS_01261 [Bradybaena similaris]
MEGDCMKTILITANVGSIFEEPETMFPEWLKAFFQCLQTHKPGLVALHCQEVGGKNYEASMQHVNQFIKTLLASDELHKYDRARIFLDEDYTASDKFTALGNMYFIHEEVSEVLIWDFVDCKFIEVEGREVLSGNIENVPIKEKAKFPQYFFPEFKWSRKGFLRTRWSINNCIFDLVNIHLFHDASNIVAMETSPSVYSDNRQRALLHTLQRFENDKYSKVPLFIFGDFNFRLDSNLLIQELTAKLIACQTTGKKGQVNKIEYTEEGNGKIVLTVGSKSFDYYEKHSDLFASMYKWLLQYDSEFLSFRDRLYEHEITFPPSYPFCEDVADGISYMKTRVPSWCDRVLHTHSARDIIIEDPSHPIVYDLIGKDVCMGDHKPAYLFIHMKPGKGNSEQQKQSLPDSSTTKPLSPLDRKRTLSINGELIESVDFSINEVDLSTINIHDYAVFEKEHALIPEFRQSIKNRKLSDKAGEKSGGSELSQPTVTRTRSFQEVAKQVRTMEMVLLQWLKRPSSRHHSSSSEDFALGESENASVSSAPAVSSDRETGEVSDHADEKVASSDIFETNNNTNSSLLNDSNSHVEIQGDASIHESAVKSDVSMGLRVGLDGSTGVLPEAGQLDGCGGGSNGTPKGVVLLAEHDGFVYADSSAPPSTPTSAPHSCSGGKEVQSVKPGEAVSASPPTATGCCSCIVL